MVRCGCAGVASSSLELDSELLELSLDDSVGSSLSAGEWRREGGREGVSGRGGRDGGREGMSE